MTSDHGSPLPTEALTQQATDPGFTGGVVVTGGGGLLGQVLVERFAALGHDVLVADLDLQAAESVAARAQTHGVHAAAAAVDVSDADAVHRLAERADAELGRIGLLCNNAGLSIQKPVTELTQQDWDAVLGVQLHGVVHGITAFLPRLLAQDGESFIVNVASMSGVGRGDLRTTNLPYVTAKFGVVGLSEAMAPALAEHGIGVSVLCPGLTVADPAQMHQALADPGVAENLMPSARWYAHNVLGPGAIADEVVAGIAERRLHIFPHRAGRREVEDRHEAVLRGFDQAERTSPPLA